MLTPKTKHPERRHHRRITVTAEALLRGDETVFSGKIINISDQGAYVATNAPYAIDSLVDLVVYFDHGTTRLSVTLPSRVARIDGKGIGLDSSHLDANLLYRLELIFDAAKGNTKQLIEEFCKTV